MRISWQKKKNFTFRMFQHIYQLIISFKQGGIYHA